LGVTANTALAPGQYASNYVILVPVLSESTFHCYEDERYATK